jgi:hypothetical protein
MRTDLPVDKKGFDMCKFPPWAFNISLFLSFPLTKYIAI